MAMRKITEQELLDYFRAMRPNVIDLTPTQKVGKWTVGFCYDTPQKIKFKGGTDK